MHEDRSHQLSTLKTYPTEDIYEIAYLNPYILKWRVEVLFTFSETIALCALLSDMGRHFKIRYRNLIWDSMEDGTDFALLNLFFNRLSGRFLKDE